MQNMFIIFKLFFAWRILFASLSLESLVIAFLLHFLGS